MGLLEKPLAIPKKKKLNILMKKRPMVKKPYKMYLILSVKNRKTSYTLLSVRHSKRMVLTKMMKKTMMTLLMKILKEEKAI